MRYSAVTGDLNGFKDYGYALRQVHFDPPRVNRAIHRRFFKTMYYEDEGLFTRTTRGVMKNTTYLCKRDRSRTRDKDG